jgi:hypothetical protein
MLAASIGQGNGVRFSRPKNSAVPLAAGRGPGQVREPQAAVLDCELELIALKESPVVIPTA